MMNSLPLKFYSERTSSILAGCLLSLLFSCNTKEHKAEPPLENKPIVTDGGIGIEFTDESLKDYFKTAPVHISSVQAEFNAPARVVATIIRSVENTDQNLVLFDNPDLTANYTAILQHLTNINTYKVNLDRVIDLSLNGAATGKEVIEARTLLANERTAIIEDEAKLKLAGLDPETLIKGKVNSIWLICDIPETQIDNIKTRGKTKVQFSSFPETIFTGNIDDFGDVVDRVTRMVKLRISIANPNSQLKAGMFATVQFGIKEGRYIAVPKEALVTVQGKNYVFIKGDGNKFERREVSTGDQINNQILVFSGLKDNDFVAVTGVMQLKGLSFGY
jgi:multidrug efflux pump subunit AcrA (membrane-fusion protein)